MHQNVCSFCCVIHSVTCNLCLYFEASLKNLLSTAKNVDLIEGIVSSLITRMITRMCSPSQGNGKLLSVVFIDDLCSGLADFEIFCSK